MKDFDTLMAEARDRLWARKKLADELAALGRPIRFTTSNGRALVQADMSEPGMYRITTFDAHGPWGHTQHNTMVEALYDALARGYTPQPIDQGASAP